MATDRSDSFPPNVLALVGLAPLFAFAFGLLDFAVPTDLASRPQSGGSDAVGPSLAFQFEYWFFDPSGSSPGLVALVCAGLVWNRLPDWIEVSRKDSPRNARRLGASGWMIGALAWMAWAELNEAADLRFISLSFLLAAWATWTGGRTGLRAVVAPCVVLMLALPIPFPLRNELLWSLQTWSAAGSEALLSLFGFDVSRSGAHLVYQDLAFLVIEGCSGLRSILTLTLVAIVIRELLELRNRKGWALIFAAPPLALLLNIIRISIIMLGSTAGDPDLDSEHVEQGVAVLVVGTTLLFFLGHFLARAPGVPEPRRPLRSMLPLMALPALVGALLLLCIIRLAIAPWPTPSANADALKRSVPESARGWTSTQSPLDYPFLGVLPRDWIESRLYSRERPIDRLGYRPVDLLIASSDAAKPRESPISSKLRVPGREWEIISQETFQDFTLGRAIELNLVRSREGSSLVYSWTSNDEGLLRDSIRSLLALERGPFARQKPRFMIQIAADLGTEPEAAVHTRKILDRFVHDFRDALRAF